MLQLQNLFQGIPAPPGGWIPGKEYNIMGSTGTYPSITTLPVINEIQNLAQSIVPSISNPFSTAGGWLTTAGGMWGIYRIARRRRVDMLSAALIAIAIVSNWSRIKSWLPQNQSGGVNTAMTLAMLAPGSLGNFSRLMAPATAGWSVGLASILIPLATAWASKKLFPKRSFRRKFKTRMMRRTYIMPRRSWRYK